MDLNKLFTPRIPGSKKDTVEAAERATPEQKAEAAAWFSHRLVPMSQRAMRRIRERDVNRMTKRYYANQRREARRLARLDDHAAIMAIRMYEGVKGLPAGGLLAELIEERKVYHKASYTPHEILEAAGDRVVAP